MGKYVRALPVHRDTSNSLCASGVRTSGQRLATWWQTMQVWLQNGVEEFRTFVLQSMRSVIAQLCEDVDNASSFRRAVLD
jgi:hypothetical protein